MPNLWDSLLLLSRFGLYLGVAGTLGASFALLVFQHRGRTVRLRRYLQLSALIGLTAVAVGFLTRAAAMGDSFAAALDSLFLSILWQTGVGSGTRWQLSGFVALLLGSVFLGGLSWRRRLALPLIVGGGLALLWSFTFSGHLAGQPWFNKSALAMHVLAMSLWLGSFYPLLTLKESSAASNLRIFSALGVWIVALLATCGIWMTLVLLPSFSDLIASDYGKVLLIKLSLLVLLLILAAANKWFWLPRVATHPRGMRHSIQGEILVALFILLVTAILANLVSPH